MTRKKGTQRKKHREIPRVEPLKHRPYRGRRETYSPTCGKTTLSRTGERIINARQYEAATSEDGEDPQGHTSDLLGRTLASEKNTGNEARRTDPLKGQTPSTEGEAKEHLSEKK